MMSVRAIAAVFRMSPKALRYHLNKNTAPDYQIRTIKGRPVKFYDIEEVKAWFDNGR